MKEYNLERQAAEKGGKIEKELQESFQRTRSIRNWNVLIQAMAARSPGPMNSLNNKLGCVLGSTPGVRGKSGASSWAFHIADPCDPWCDGLAHCWGAIKHRAKDASLRGSAGGLCQPGMAGSRINPCLSRTRTSVGAHSPGL